jgi:hypothetical protein
VLKFKNKFGTLRAKILMQYTYYKCKIKARFFVSKSHFNRARGGAVVKATNRQVAGSIPDGVTGIFQ